MSEDNREGRVAGARDGKTMIGAYVTKDTLYTLQELLLKLSRQHGKKMTMNDFILSALRTECTKHNVKIDS